jgi:hypothetical protein
MRAGNWLTRHSDGVRFVEADREARQEPIREAFREGRWLSYSELAEIRGIGRPSAVKLAQRERWRRIPGNDRDRTVRVLVPPEWLQPSKAAPIRELLREAVREPIPEAVSLARQLEAANTRADDANARADGANKRADAALALAADANARADRAEAATSAERTRANDERSRADAINALLEATQEELAGQRELTDQARADAERAHAEAEALRQAEAARKARGLVARLRAAWQGE